VGVLISQTRDEFARYFVVKIILFYWFLFWLTCGYGDKKYTSNWEGKFRKIHTI